MSLLLKALEKSEGEKDKDEGATAPGQTPAADAASDKGGFKLAGAGSKLGSALASQKPTDDETKQAGRVVAAYQTEEEDPAAAQLAAASRKARITNLIRVGVVIVVAGAGWFGYQEYGSQFLPQPGPSERRTEASVGQEVTSESVSTLLPLAEPIYDIQENILIASLSSSAVAASNDQDDEENVAQQVTEVVSGIIESQLIRERESIIARDRQLNIQSEVSINEEIQELLSEDFDPENARIISSNDGALAELEALSANIYLSNDGRQFVKSSGQEIAAVETLETDDSSTTVSTQSPAGVVVAREKNSLKEVLDEGVASYQAGDLNNAEKAFRTIIAAEPRNVSALIGLAKVHQSRGNARLAVATFLKASEYSPNNPAIVSELIAIQSTSANPVFSENRIRTLLTRADSPEIESRLMFLLGNMYAKQGRWFDAKGSFLAAHTLNRANPDIAYNLAVIHDYLNEPTKAVAMYQEALSSAVSSPSSFDHSVARARVDQLSNN